MQGNAKKFMEMQGHIRKYTEIRRNTKEYKEMQGNIRKCKEMQGRIRKCTEMRGNTKKCKEITGSDAWNARKYEEMLGNSGNAERGDFRNGPLLLLFCWLTRGPLPCRETLGYTSGYTSGILLGILLGQRQYCVYSESYTSIT